MNPLTALYGRASSFRNRLYDRGVLRSRRLERPVVSVGNLTVGGAGKTPFVIALGRLLLDRGIHFDVLSRGYGRKTHGVLVVEPSGSASEFGDEPLLIARHLHVPVIVGESRYQAGLIAEQRFESELHLLDDGFQHRSLARDCDIVLVAPDDFRDRLLPSGRLREPLPSLKRADVIVVPLDMERNHPALEQKLVWQVERNIEVSPRLSAPIVFCGIARPTQFFAQARAVGMTPAAEIAFRDHHSYDHSDVKRLQDLRAKSGADGFLTTEKDAINLGSLENSLTPLSVAALKLTIHPADAVDTILARIAERKRRS